jgi:hypothetical protein
MGEHEHEAQLDEFASRAEHARVLRAPTAESIGEVARQIRTTITAAFKPPPPARITIEPATIDFGEIRRGNFVEADVMLKSDRPAQVALQLAAAPAGVTMDSQNVKAPARVHVRVDVAKDAAPGAGELTFKAGNAIAKGTVAITTPSPLRWLLLLPIIAAIAWFAYARRRKNNQLEGELEILQPQVSHDAAYIGLPRLATNEVALSTIVPRDALGGSDARLFVRRSGNRKEVWIATSSGSLRVNDIETPTSALYDADTIAIGDAKLRFNRVGCERTTSAEEEL